MPVVISAKYMAPFRALARRLAKVLLTLTPMGKYAQPLTLTPMGKYAQVSDSEMLFRRGNSSFWEAHPETTFPGHPGFSKELSHGTPAAPIPEWMMNDSGWTAPPVRFVRMNDAILWLFEGIAMTASGDVIADSAVTLREFCPDLTVMPGMRLRNQRTVFDRRTLRNIEVIDGPVLMPANGWNRAFGHWIYDTLAAICTFIEPIRSGRLRLVMSELTSWQRSWLNFLGVPEAAVIEGGFGYVRARHAIIPSTLSIQNVRYPGPHIVELIEFLRSLPQDCAPATPYLYLSRLGRGDSSHRTLENEDRIISSLGRLGFVSVAPETFTPAEQIALFAQARVILGPVGSAFALSGLASPGATIVEILPPPAAHSWMYRSSAILNQRYGCIMAEVIPDSRRDGKEHGITRPGWFYSYQADHDVVLRVAERAMHLSA